MKRLAILLSISILGLSNPLAAAGLGESNSGVTILRVEKVGSEALGSASAAEASTYTRVVAKANNGRYLVSVHSNIGVLRMQGAFLDSTLKVEDGIFTYYHSNGRLECKGCFSHGVKSGTWFRYDVNGTQLSERVYTGRPVDELVKGAKAPTVSARVTPVTDKAVRTDKRHSTIEF